MWFISASSEVIPAAKRSLSRYFANAGACTIRRTSLTPFSMISASRASDRKRGSMRGDARGSLLVKPTSPRIGPQLADAAGEAIAKMHLAHMVLEYGDDECN